MKSLRLLRSSKELLGVHALCPGQAEGVQRSSDQADAEEAELSACLVRGDPSE